MEQRRGRTTLLGLAIVAYFLTLFAKLVISPVVPDIIETFGTSKSAIGLALTAMWASFALVQYPAGILGDRYGEKPVILAAIAVTGIAGLLVALAPSYGVFVLVVVLLGFGAGLYPASGTSLLAKRFTRTGQVLGLHVAGANLAGLVAPILAAYVAVRYGWRAAPVLVILLAIPVFVLFFTGVRPTVPSRPDVTMRDRFTVGAFSDILSRRPILFTTLIGIIGQFTFGAIASFLPTFLIEFWGLGTERAGAVFGIVYLFSALAMPLTGRLSDVIGRDLSIMGSLTMTTAGLSLLLVGRGVIPALAA
ncbi:MAG: MFS transporter, partial [Halobacteriales archaeon]|nr:MFS transporter [Halobacteriales archaeon]